MILIWNQYIKKIYNNNIEYTLTEKPELGFNFLHINYDDNLKIYIKSLHDESVTLTDYEIEKCKEYIENLISKNVLYVYVYDLNGFYTECLQKSSADELKYNYTEIAPIDPASKFIDNTWNKIEAIITEDGNLIKYPRDIPINTAIALTTDEWVNFPQQNSAIEVYNFKTKQWEDQRNLEKEKERIKFIIRQHFSKLREAHNFSIPLLERETWRTQENEAKKWKKDNTYSTPFIDKIIENRTITKEEMCDRIIKDVNNFTLEMATIHNKQLILFDKLNNAKDLQTVDEILNELLT